MSHLLVPLRYLSSLPSQPSPRCRFFPGAPDSRDRQGRFTRVTVLGLRDVLRESLKMILEKATTQHHFTAMYADLCVWSCASWTLWRARRTTGAASSAVWLRRLHLVGLQMHRTWRLFACRWVAWGARDQSVRLWLLNKYICPDDVFLMIRPGLAQTVSKGTISYDSRSCQKAQKTQDKQTEKRWASRANGLRSFCVCPFNYLPIKPL